MRILLLAPYFPPEGGGLESYASAMAEDLSKEHEVRIICMSRRRSSRERVRVGDSVLPVERVKAGFVISNTPLSLRFVLRVISTVKSWNPDLIIAHTPVPSAADAGALASLLFGVPLLIVYHTVGLKKGSATDVLASLYSRTLERFVLSRAKRIVSVSPAVRDSLQQKGFRSTVVLPRPKSKLVKLDNPMGKEKVILFVGQLSRYHSFKNFDLLLRAFSEVSPRHPDWELWVVGGGDLLDHYRSLSERLGISGRVRFFGQVADPKELAAIYGKATILVLPSSFESFGLVVVEGLIFDAVPVVSSAIAPNFTTLGLEDGKGLITLRQKAELSSMLDELLSDPKALKKVFRRSIKDGILKRLSCGSKWARLLQDPNLLEKF
ncbi:glycosyltransferase family 4 protein [Thermococcus profundus]|uniref:glycosyltransferase family 4 protein n=1 Tax=Thermococcus profundus TaxID=49899 RepID=UPI000B5A0E24|nr:glycosyltransferase family 4 protein [Thermococcus profundus]